MNHNSGAPRIEDDRAAEAPEVDHYSRAAPEAAGDSGPQLAVSNEGLIPADHHEKETFRLAASSNDKSYPDRRWHGLSRRAWLILGILSLLGIIAIAVGTGVGVTRTSHTSSTNVTAAFPDHGILNDSSFAAVTTSDGNRHVFFQDIAGSIRHVTYSTSIRVWTTTLVASIIPNTTNARNSTPISAALQANQQNQFLGIILLYITSNFSLAAATFSNGGWTDTTINLNVSQFSTSPNTKSLSLATLPDATNSSELLLYFEDVNGEVIGLHGSHSSVLPFFTPKVLWSWENVTSGLVQSLSAASPVLLRPPFATTKSYTISPDGSTLLPSVITTFLNLNGNPNSTFVSALFNRSESTFETFIYPFNGSAVADCCQAEYVDLPAVEASDFAGTWVGNSSSIDTIEFYDLWVNGTTLSGTARDDAQPRITNPPVTPFPFTRIALTTQDGSTAFYLYHQVNASSLAEDIWDITLGSWTSSYIDIATS